MWSRTLIAVALVALIPCCLARGISQYCINKGIPAMSFPQQAPTAPSEYGKCDDTVQIGQPDSGIPSSKWCSYGGLGSATDMSMVSNLDADKDHALWCLKVGRMTVYEGPILGQGDGQLAACKADLEGDDDAASVAVSTKWLKTYQGGWAGPDGQGYCNQCMCIRLHGLDNVLNPNLNPNQFEGAQFNMVMKGKCTDRCSECENDHIDVLMDRPLSYAPFSSSDPSQKLAPLVNALDGTRGFNNSEIITNAYPGTPMNVGAYTSVWNWVPCSYTHQDCVNMFKKLGYKDSYAVGWSKGVDM